MEDVGNGRGCACVGAEDYEKSLYFPPNFSMNIKLLQK